LTDNADTSPREPQFGFIRNPQDFWGGLVLFCLVLVAWYASRDLPGQQGFAFGPGTAPRLFMILLGLVAVGIMAVGLFTDGPHVSYSPPGFIVVLGSLVLWSVIAYPLWQQLGNPYGAEAGLITATTVILALAIAGIKYLEYCGVRGPYMITLAVLSFAAYIRPLGLVIATFLLVIVSGFGTTEMRWKESLIWAIVLSAFCAVLFPYVLNLPMQLWPRW
jgi:putative tricarboxylic transport membrane protein